jgi:phospho-N-acetylmuramoyl-pentapeptide-transferase
MILAQYIIPFAISFALTFSVMPSFIGFMQVKTDGQRMLEELEEAHKEKQGTPTMGGLVFLTSITISTLATAIWTRHFSASLLILLFIILLYGLLGFLDDFIKIFRKRNAGLSARHKLIGQIIGGIIFYLVFRYEGLNSSLNILGRFELPLGMLYGVFIIIWLVGFSNAVNLTDGLDGLSSISVVISMIAYAFIAWHQQQYDVLIVIFATIGGLLAFFWFNHKPAKVFMGDVGSLALGGLLAAISSLLRQEWTLLLIGLVYVFETTSVMLQVGSFKLRGKRIFRMAPLHHHFELGGLTGKGEKWSEWKVDIVFWIIGAIASTIAVLLVLF